MGEWFEQLVLEMMGQGEVVQTPVIPHDVRKGICSQVPSTNPKHQTHNKDEQDDVNRGKMWLSKWKSNMVKIFRISQQNTVLACGVEANP